jgi:SAM-dependent methyltransferase
VTGPTASPPARQHRGDQAVSHAAIATYYTGRLAKHGATPLGVDWSCAATQMLRFVKLLQVCDFGAPFSLNDVGCGYGALARFLDERHPDAEVDYLGVDLAAAMVRSARRRHRGRSDRRFSIGSVSPRVADYSVASGIMNVSLGHARAAWERHVAAILDDMCRTSRRGFAVNFLDQNAGGAIEQLYRTTAANWVGYCKERLGSSVQTVAGYGLREFTLLVRRA